MAFQRWCSCHEQRSDARAREPADRRRAGATAVVSSRRRTRSARSWAPRRRSGAFRGGLRRADRLRWLAGPGDRPAGGYLLPALAAHPVVVTNQRGISTTASGAHQCRSCSRSRAGCTSTSGSRCGPSEALGPSRRAGAGAPAGGPTALIVAWRDRRGERRGSAPRRDDGGSGSTARREESPRACRAAPAGGARRLFAAGRLRVLTIPTHARDRGPVRRGEVQADEAERLLRQHSGVAWTTKSTISPRRWRCDDRRGAGLDVYEDQPLPGGPSALDGADTLLTPQWPGMGRTWRSGGSRS